MLKVLILRTYREVAFTSGVSKRCQRREIRNTAVRRLLVNALPDRWMLSEIGFSQASVNDEESRGKDSD